jgi:hypothetical protein
MVFFQLWIRPLTTAHEEEDEEQVVLASGEYALSWLATTQKLRWTIGSPSSSGSASYTILSSPLPLDTYTHVTLAFGRETLSLLVDHVVVGEASRRQHGHRRHRRLAAHWIMHATSTNSSHALARFVV